MPVLVFVRNRLDRNRAAHFDSGNTILDAGIRMDHGTARIAGGHAEKTPSGLAGTNACLCLSNSLIES